MKEPHLPVSTYRLQFTNEFGFDEAAALIPYLETLGITDLYASPLFQARDGSEHGYDVTNPRRLDPEVGGRSGFEELSAGLKARNMGLLLDIVPNHMAASPENPWWRDILLRGRRSVHAGKFDIDWDREQESKLVLPMLGAPLEEVLARGELKLSLESDGFKICCGESRLPVCPDSYRYILFEYHRIERNALRSRPAPALPLTLKAAIDSKRAATLTAEEIQGGKSFWSLYQHDGQAREYIGRALDFWNGAAGKKHFAKLLQRQYYRLVYWKDRRSRINYRRFFDINDLVTLRIEDEAVFRAVHARVLELTREGAVTGLRIDHVDGLHDPQGYLTRLDEQLAKKRPDNGPAPAETAAASNKRGTANFYLLVEKILKNGEEIPDSWPAAGTTGYDFLNTLNGLFVDARGLCLLNDLYTQTTGYQINFAELVYEQKQKVIRDLFYSEMEALAEELACLAKQDLRARKIAPGDLEAALVSVTAAFPVYRSYTRSLSVATADREYVDEALAAAADYGDSPEPARAFLRRLLLMEINEDMPEKLRQGWLSFVMRWQQLTGPIMAKGFEDTALYLYNRLISLNEVGGNPSAGTVSVTEFHRLMQARHKRSPHTMNTTSTHDTKRSEDVRARLNVLSEMPELWASLVSRWQEWNAPKKLPAAGRLVPDGNFELLLYQTLIGAWPLDKVDEAAFSRRLKDYLVKVSREAKAYTSWLDPDDEYERAFCAFALRILEDNPENRFRQELQSLVKVVAYYGAVNSLAQVLLKVVCPGVPDFFMGNELWRYSLVDPDNRRPVDFERRIKLLAELQRQEASPGLTRKLLENWEDGRLKLYVTWKALCLRREKAGLFASGSYLPLETAGPAEEHLCALARQGGGDWALAVTPRLPVRMLHGEKLQAIPEATPPVGIAAWKDTALLLPASAPARWQNIFTGEIISTAPAAGQAPRSCAENESGKLALPLDRVLSAFPLALLTPQAQH